MLFRSCTHPLTSPLTVHPGLFADLCLHRRTVHGLKLLILDEPVSALDVSVGAQIVNLLRKLQSDFGMTYLFISHSMPLVRYLSTRIAVMQHGRLVELGAAEALCAAPRQAYTRQLLLATPELPADVA